MTKYASLGSISSGTMRTEDLISAFRDALEELDPDMTQSETVYVVRDASGEYLSGKHGGRTPAGDEAKEFATFEEARRACERATDRVLSREVE